MKLYILILSLAICRLAKGQTIVNKSYLLKGVQQVEFNFKYPVIKVSTWKGNDVSVVAHVKINNSENDNAFLLEDKTENGVLTISDQIKDLDKLPHLYTIYKNGEKTTYHDKKDFLEAQKGGGIQRTSEGLGMEITLEIKVPENITTKINAVYGMVELKDFKGPIAVTATYGGIDATLKAENTGSLQATTNYGQIYTNLNLKIVAHKDGDFLNSITAEPGRGPTYSFTSPYGKIYLRRP